MKCQTLILWKIIQKVRMSSVTIFLSGLGVSEFNNETWKYLCSWKSIFLLSLRYNPPLFLLLLYFFVSSIHTFCTWSRCRRVDFHLLIYLVLCLWFTRDHICQIAQLWVQITDISSKMVSVLDFLPNGALLGKLQRMVGWRETKENQWYYFFIQIKNLSRVLAI